MSAPPHFELDASVRRHDGGRLLVGGTPPRLVRLSPAGSRALDSVLAGGEPDAAALALTGRLDRHGLLHPLPEDDGGGEPEVTTVVPVLDGGERLACLVGNLVAEGPVIVVDDGSRDGSGARAEAAGARVLRHPAPRGPAAARNAGLAAAATDLVAFVDADCEVAPGWRRGLAGMFADRSLALVAPRVRGAPGSSSLARYERLFSPLDLGPAPGLVGPDRRPAYLPAAALLGRRTALLELGGFDESMRFGEDVDLVWRLLDAGRRVRYVPSREVLHAPRRSAGALTRQRAGYGAAAPDLARRHGAAAAPLRVGPRTAAIGVLAGLRPVALAPALTISTAVISARGDDRKTRIVLASLALRGNAGAGRHLARVAVREWLPVSLLAATRSRRARRLLLLAAVIDLLPVWRGAANPREAISWTGFAALERAGFAAGLWRESWRRGVAGALLPRLGR